MPFDCAEWLHHEPYGWVTAIAFHDTRAQLVLGTARVLEQKDASPFIEEVHVGDGVRWTPVTGATTYIPEGGMSYDARRNVVVAIGVDPANDALPVTWEFDGDSWTMRNVATPPWRYWGMMTYDESRGVVILFGGWRNDQLSDLWEYDGAEWRRITAPGPSARNAAAFAYDPSRGVCVLFGGLSDDPAPDARVWEWDGAAWTSHEASGPDARNLASFVANAATGELWLVSTQVGTVWTWDGKAWREVETIDMPRTTSHSSPPRVASDTRAMRILLYDMQGECVWECSTGPWTALCGKRPTQRTGFCVVYDNVRGAAVLVGGQYFSGGASVFPHETWELASGEWRLAAVGGPRQTAKAPLAFDERRGVCVYVSRNADRQIETWEWDGAAWRLRATGGPRNPEAAATAYDRNRSVTVLIEPQSSSGEKMNTWEWDGDQWLLRDSNGLSHRYGAAMCYDPESRRCIAFGGIGSSGSMNDTWAWDGARWTIVTVNGPEPRWNAGLAYQPETRQIVLVGGEATESLGQTWELSAGHWVRRDHSNLPFMRQGNVYFDSNASLIRALAGVTDSNFLQVFEQRPTQPRLSIGAPSVSFVDGARVNLAAHAAGDALSYQWRRNGLPLIDDGRITGSQTPVLHVHEARTADAGRYDLIAVGTCASVLSAPVTLTHGCSGDLNGDARTDGADLSTFLPLMRREDDTADLNGDGAVNAADLGVILAGFGCVAVR